MTVYFVSGFFFFVVDFEIRTSHLLSKQSTIWAMSSLFSLVNLKIECFFWFFYFLSRLFWIMLLLFQASCCRWGNRCTPPLPAFFCWNGVLLNFCPFWSQTAILPISAFQVARIIGINHSAWPNGFLKVIKTVKFMLGISAYSPFFNVMTTLSNGLIIYFLPFISSQWSAFRINMKYETSNSMYND
jgi:hypothetical protein